RTKQKLDIDISDLPSLKIQLESYKNQLLGSASTIIREYEEQKNELEQLKVKESDLKKEIQDLEREIHGYDVQIQQEPDVKYDTLVKLKPFFEEVANTLLKTKKAKIEQEMTELLNVLLLSYKNSIDRVELSDSLDDFYIRMYHKAGNEISLAHLNAASKQIFIQVMLKVLRNLGDYNPPVMIDTVMGVLDEDSREALMEVYFPKLADQTILLCTTSEIRKESDYIKLEPFIAKTYTLIRKPETQNTVVEENYFGITLRD
ncbi:MAG: DNA sulfur modification protein DndD, partial [Prevotella sp.]|nr:DNA sulfur modification protein DndD [Prevotella sp.]